MSKKNNWTVKLAKNWTSTPEKGLIMRCPHCEEAALVYHMGWGSLFCNFCGKMNTKSDWGVFRCDQESPSFERIRAELEEWQNRCTCETCEAIREAHQRLKNHLISNHEEGQVDPIIELPPVGEPMPRAWNVRMEEAVRDMADCSRIALNVGIEGYFTLLTTTMNRQLVYCEN